MQRTDWLTTGEVARRLGVTTQTVRNWTRDSKLPGVRTSSGDYVFEAHVIDALAQGPGARRNLSRTTNEPAEEPFWPAVLIRGLAWDRFDPHDGAELGGALLGMDLDDRLVVEAVVEDARAVRSRTQISHDLSDLRAHEGDVVRTGVRLLGSWHGHPDYTSAVASAQDKRSWAATAAVVRRIWLGIVVCQMRSGPTSPLDVNAYLTRPDGEVKWVSSPLRI